MRPPYLVSSARHGPRQRATLPAAPQLDPPLELAPATPLRLNIIITAPAASLHQVREHIFATTEMFYLDIYSYQLIQAISLNTH